MFEDDDITCESRVSRRPRFSLNDKEIQEISQSTIIPFVLRKQRNLRKARSRELSFKSEIVTSDFRKRVKKLGVLIIARKINKLVTLKSGFTLFTNIKTKWLADVLARIITNSNRSKLRMAHQHILKQTKTISQARKIALKGIMHIISRDCDAKKHFFLLRLVLADRNKDKRPQMTPSTHVSEDKSMIRGLTPSNYSAKAVFGLSNKQNTLQFCSRASPNNRMASSYWKVPYRIF